MFWYVLQTPVHLNTWKLGDYLRIYVLIAFLLAASEQPVKETLKKRFFNFQGLRRLVDWFLTGHFWWENQSSSDIHDNWNECLYNVYNNAEIVSVCCVFNVKVINSNRNLNHYNAFYGVNFVIKVNSTCKCHSQLGGCLDVHYQNISAKILPILFMLLIKLW